MPRTLASRPKLHIRLSEEEILGRPLSPKDSGRSGPRFLSGITAHTLATTVSDISCERRRKSGAGTGSSQNGAVSALVRTGFYCSSEKPIVIPKPKPKPKPKPQLHKKGTKGYLMSTDTLKTQEDLDREKWEKGVLEHRHVSCPGAAAQEIHEYEDWDCLRIACAKVLNSSAFRVAMTLLIIFNITVVVEETNLRAEHKVSTLNTSSNPSPYIAPRWLQNCTTSFLAIYTVEVIARIYVLRWQYATKSLMNVFDLSIVMLDIISEVLNVAFGDLPSISFLRVLRVLRIVRVIRQFLIFRELYLMMQGLVSAMRAIVFATLMVAVVLTMWAIVSVELVHKLNWDLAHQGVYGLDPLVIGRTSNAFSSVWAALCTLIKTIIAGDSWGQLALPIMEAQPITCTIFFSALLTVQLGLLNLIVAIIVDRAAQARHEDEDLQQTVKQEEFVSSFSRLMRLFNSMDEDCSGTLTCDELEMAYDSHPEFAAIMKLMDITQDDMSLVFEVMDRDRSGDVDYKEFVEQLHTMRNIDAHTLLVFVRHNVGRIRERLEDQDTLCEFIKRRTIEQDEQLRDIRDMLRNHEGASPSSLNRVDSCSSAARCSSQEPESRCTTPMHGATSLRFTTSMTEALTVEAVLPAAAGPPEPEVADERVGGRRDEDLFRSLSRLQIEMELCLEQVRRRVRLSPGALPEAKGALAAEPCHASAAESRMTFAGALRALHVKPPRAVHVKLQERSQAEPQLGDMPPDPPCEPFWPEVFASDHKPELPGWELEAPQLQFLYEIIQQLPPEQLEVQAQGGLELQALELYAQGNPAHVASAAERQVCGEQVPWLNV